MALLRPSVGQSFSAYETSALPMWPSSRPSSLFEV